VSNQMDYLWSIADDLLLNHQWNNLLYLFY
jgi:hypothetical protein